MIAIQHRTPRPSSPAWHKRFLVMLPTIVGFARRSLRSLPPEALEDAVAEVVANTTVAYARLVERGRENIAYPTVLAMYAVRQYRDGRRVGVKMNSNDVYSQHAQARGNFSMQHIGAPGEQRYGWREQLTENCRTPVAEQAAFRIDFPQWLLALSQRDRRIIEDLAFGERTGDVAVKYGVSPSRISQMRKQLQEGWERFVGDIDECDDTDAT
jgi:hypothetical protein